MTLADGRMYDGMWKNGLQDGEGRFTSAFGLTQKGVWKAGKAVKFFAASEETTTTSKINFSK